MNYLRVKNDHRSEFSNLSNKRFEPSSHFKSRLSLIVRVNVILNRTVVVDSDLRLCGSHLQSQSELYRVSWWYYTIWLLIWLVNYVTTLLVVCQLRCFDTVFRRPYRYFSIALKGILSLSDRYNIFASDWLWIEIFQNEVLTKIDITMTTINKNIGNW